VKTIFIAIISIALSVAAQFSLKAGMSGEGVRAALAQPYSLRTLFDLLTDKYVLGGFLLYGLGAVVWLGVLSKWDVSKAYPLVGMGFVFTVAIGFLVGEQVTVPRVIGVALICAGVYMVGRS
jgi:drug/metabolite transporter (DMT)-like permease